MLRAIAGWVLVVAALAGCAGSRRGSGADTLVRWPFAGMNPLTGPAMAPYREQFFSGRLLNIDPGGRWLFAEAGRPGALTIASLPEGRIATVYEFGAGSQIEDFIFEPSGGVLYVLASTVQAENFGQVQLARALLKVDYGMPLLQAPIALQASGYSHGLVIQPHRGVVFSLDTAGPDLAGGASLSRIDLITDEQGLRRPVGGLPEGVRRRGLALDDREERIYAILSEGGAGSDFDPIGRREASGTSYLAALDPDSLGIRERLNLPLAVDYTAVVTSPRGVLVVGNTRQGTSLIDIDTRLMRQVGWLDLPRTTTDVAVNGGVAVLPSRQGLFVVDLTLLTLRAFLPVDFFRPGDAAVSPDGQTACVIMEDPQWPGRPALGIVNLTTGRLERVTR